MERPLVLVLSYVVPHARSPHAGGRYLHDLCEVVQDFGDVVLLAADTTVNRNAMRQPGAPAGTRLLTVRGPLGYLATNVDRWLRRWDPGAPYLPFVLGLVGREGRQLLRSADVVDLQWEDMIRLAGLIALFRPRARVVGTFHDVQSQSFDREAATQPQRARYWRRLAASARRRERRALRHVHAAVAFSEKDVGLLDGGARVSVLRPPLGKIPEGGLEKAENGQPRVLFVAYFARSENIDAAMWLLSDIWPTVVGAVPDAQLRLVGAGVPGHLAELAASMPSVTLTGFVEDLEEEYFTADVVVVPLRVGAGLKFKTVEAMVRDLPVVSTSIGAEGVAPPELFARVKDGADDIAEAVIDVLRGPDRYRQRAKAAGEWARDAYGDSAFRVAVKRLYEGDCQ